MYDLHIHSQYSMDSTEDMEKSVIQAVKNNIKTICFTDHVDFDSTSDGVDFVFRVSDYFRDINKVKYKYKDDIEILAGVEIGMQPHLYGKYNNFVENNLFDFVLMSIHSVNNQDIYVDNFTEGRVPEEAILEYYASMLECVKGFSNFDILGHIDYIDRYFSSNEEIPTFDVYKDILEEILKVVIEKGKGIELNTSGFRKKLGYFHPKLPILEMYRDLGGKIITIGSDSHTAENIGANYKSAEKMLKDLGFKHIYIYKERKKFPINIL